MSGFPQLPGYEIQSELGRGGMAVVYSAIEADLGRQVAIKVVRGDATEPGHIQRLENEARGLAALHHPHIVDLYRFGRTEDGSLFYVMPLLPGGSLEDVPKPMPEERVVALLDNLLDALAHAHAADIIHRDIKPANILFDRHGRPLLADFGAAFMRKRDARLTSHGHAIGSSGFMSPEQARGMAVDARSDLYSVAVLAFELLTGKMPFEGEDALSTALAQIEQPVPLCPNSSSTGSPSSTVRWR
jgi:serine/threonine protein kinase